MSLAAVLTAVGCLILVATAAVHDELPECGLTGVYKARQSLIESPNYPENYPAHTCLDYVVRSPYRCPTKFHIQFLDFLLESSKNCTNDYLAIGLENDEDDMDVLCGQVIGIKKYRTPDGILRLRFFADASPWTTEKGFKLLVTRLACERDDLLRETLDALEEDTVQVNAPAADLLPPQTHLATLFRNISLQDQHRPYWPVPPQPGVGGLYVPARHDQRDQAPCTTTSTGASQQPLNQDYLRGQELPAVPDQYSATLFRPRPATRANDDLQISGEPCCVSSFREKHFYLSSPGFPRTVFTSLLPAQQRDCQFFVEKTTHGICRLRVEFKYFDFGQGYAGTGARQGNIDVAIGSSRDVCTEDFVEIDGERFCGCRSGFVQTTLWGLGKKIIRMRMGYSGVPSSGFLLDIKQEDCSGTSFLNNGVPAQNNVIQQSNFNNPALQQQSDFNNPALQQQSNFQNIPNGVGFGLQQNTFPLQQGFFGQQQLPPHLLQPQTLPAFSEQQMPIYQRPFYQPGQGNAYQQLAPSNPLWAAGVPGHQFVLPVPQFRHARELNYAKAAAQQPLTVVETNSTRKEFYYYDGDEAFARSRSLSDEPTDSSGMFTKLFSRQRNRCSFDSADVLRLSVDRLWLTKPTCYSPQRSWFGNLGNFFG